MKFYIQCPKCGYKLSPEMKHALEKGECPSCGQVLNVADALGVIEFLNVSNTLKLPLKGAQYRQLIDVYFKEKLGLKDIPEIFIEEDMADRMRASTVQPETPQAPPVNNQPQYAQPQAPAMQPDLDDTGGEAGPGGIDPESLISANPTSTVRPKMDAQNVRKVVRPAVKGQGDDPDRPALIVNKYGLLAADVPTNVKLNDVDLEKFKAQGALPVMPITKVGDPNKGDAFTEKVPGLSFMTEDDVAALKMAVRKNKGHMNFSQQQEQLYEALDKKAEREALELQNGLAGGQVVDQSVGTVIPPAAGSSGVVKSVSNILNAGHTVHDDQGRPVTLPKLSTPGKSRVMISDASSILTPQNPDGGE